MAKHEFNDLVAQLKASRPAAPKIPADFKSSLRARLLSEYGLRTASTTPSWRHVYVFVGVLALALVLGFLWSPRGSQVASAAELLQQANEALRKQAGGADVLYDRLLLEIQTGLVSNRGVTVEVWQSKDGQQFRYLLKTSDGSLLYFAQRNGNVLWRSLHKLPTGAEPVHTIYRMTVAHFRQSIVPEIVEGKTFLQSELSTGWLEIDRMISDSAKTCIDLFCLLGITGENWQCQAGSCTLLMDGRPVAEAQLQEDEVLPGGRIIHVVAIRYSNSNWKRVVKIDAKTKTLIEVANYEGYRLVDRLQHIERLALATTDVPAELFSSVPEDIEVISLETPAIPEVEQAVDPNPSQPARTDRLWIVSVSPEPGSAIDNPTEFHIKIGYELVSLPEANLKVMLWPGFDWTGGPTEGSEFIKVSAGNGTLDIHFNVASVTLASGKWMLRTTLGTFEGNQLIPLYNKTWSKYEWCIRCTETPSQ